MPEISDEELSQLRGAQKLMGELMKSPKTKRTTEKSIKTLHPEVMTDEDIAAPYVEELKGEISEIKNLLKKREDETLENTFQAKLDSYRLSASNPDGYTPEGIEKIKQLMKARTIPDVHNFLRRLLFVWLGPLTKPTESDLSQERSGRSRRWTCPGVSG